MSETLSESLAPPSGPQLTLAPEQLTQLIRGNTLQSGVLSSACRAQFAITVGNGRDMHIVTPTLDTDGETWVYTIEPQSDTVRANGFLNVPSGATQWRELPAASALILPDHARSDRQEARQTYGLLAGMPDQTDFDLAHATPVYASQKPRPTDRAEHLQGSGVVKRLDAETPTLYLLYTAEELADVSPGIAVVDSPAAVQAVLASVRSDLRLPQVPTATTPKTRTSRGVQTPVPLGAYKVRFAAPTRGTPLAAE